MCKRLGLDVDSKILHYAAKVGLVGAIKVIREKLPKGIDDPFNDKNKAGETPMSLAPYIIKPFMNPEYLKSLAIMRRATVGGANCADVQKELEECLKNVSADADAQDVRGWTPLMNAAIADDPVSCRVLLDHKAKFSTRGRYGFTALFWAEASRQSRSLVQASTPGSEPDLKVAVPKESVVSILRGKGADLSTAEKQGLLTLKRKFENGSPEVRSLLTLDAHDVILCMPKAKSCDDVSSFHSTIIDRIMDGAQSFEPNTRDLLPAGWKPETSLEDSLLELDQSGFKVCEAWHQERPGEGDFPDWKALVQHSKLFVQERVAFGDEIAPQYIFALHLYTIPCNLFSKACAAMRGKREGGIFTLDEEALKPFRTFIWYLWEALEKIRITPATVYRGITGNPISLLAGQRGSALAWPAFSSTSKSQEVALSFLRSSSKPGGIIFKIRSKRTREIADYSYRPHEHELLLPPMTLFNILGIYEASHYNLQYGEASRSTSKDMYVADTVVPQQLNEEGSFRVPDEYAKSFVLVVMEEADL